MSKLLYASPSWSGYLNAECVATIQKLLSKSVKWAVTSKCYQAADTFAVHDNKLLYLLYTAELALVVARHGPNLHQYADDTQVYVNTSAMDAEAAVGRLAAYPGA